MPDVTRRTAAFYAIAFGLAGATMARAAYVHDPRLHVPPTLGYVVAATFAVASLAVLAQASGHPRAQTGLAALLLAGMSAIAAWLATPAGVRGCRSSLGALPGLPSDFGCRTAFGAGAVICALMAAYALRQWWGAGRRSDASGTAASSSSSSSSSSGG